MRRKYLEDCTMRETGSFRSKMCGVFQLVTLYRKHCVDDATTKWPWHDTRRERERERDVQRRRRREGESKEGQRAAPSGTQTSRFKERRRETVVPGRPPLSESGAHPSEAQVDDTVARELEALDAAALAQPAVAPRAVRHYHQLGIYQPRLITYAQEHAQDVDTHDANTKHS